MSILQTSQARLRPTRPALNANDAVLRATGVLSLLAIGTIHFLQIVPTTEQTPLLGVSFLILIPACIFVAARLATHSDRRTWGAAAAVSLAAIVGYVFTRSFNSPLDNQDAGNWSCMLGLAALFIETTLLGFSAYARLATRAVYSSVRRARANTEAVRMVAGEPSAA